MWIRGISQIVAGLPLERDAESQSLKEKVFVHSVNASCMKVWLSYSVSVHVRGSSQNGTPLSVVCSLGFIGFSCSSFQPFVFSLTYCSKSRSFYSKCMFRFNMAYWEKPVSSFFFPESDSISFSVGLLCQKTWPSSMSYRSSASIWGAPLNRKKKDALKNRNGYWISEFSLL